MLEKLDRISTPIAGAVAAVGLLISLAAAALLPSDAQIGGWVRFVIWHGMLNIACAVALLVMGLFAVAYLVTRRERFEAWARSAQVALLPVWVLGTAIGAFAAKLVWNSWNLTERRMEMSIAYSAAAAVALLVALIADDHRVGAVSQVITTVAMAAGLAWIEIGPATQDIHPQSAVWSSPDVAFKVLAVVIAVALLAAVLALTVLVRRWLDRTESAE